MATATQNRQMTVEEFLALPDDGVERWLIKGEVVEFGSMTTRNWKHSSIMSIVAHFLVKWRDQLAKPRGKVLSGEAGIRLPNIDRDIVGVDVGYVSAAVMAAQSDASTIIEGVPDLVVEILSPNDTHEKINEKIDTYLEARVPLLWVIDPRRRTVTVYRPGEPESLVTSNGFVDGGDILPGLRISLAEMFEQALE